MSTTPSPASFDDASATGSSSTAASSPLASDDENAPSYCEVKSTPDRGQALFATRRIRPGTLIFTEEPLIALSKQLEESYSAIEAAFAGLTKRQKKAYLALFDAKKSRMTAVVSIYYSNCYSTESFAPANNSNDAFGSCLGSLSSRLNHSCIPNVSFSFTPPSSAHPQGQMRFYAVKAITRGKELLSNYDKSIFEPASQRGRNYRLHYGFSCKCESCLPMTEFWGRSDERRRAMRGCVEVVRSAEKGWLKAIDGGQGGNDVCQAAVDALRKLEGLLVKEGLTAVPLANVYRSLTKWTERAGEHSGMWMEKELEVSVTAFGKRSVRSDMLRDRLEGSPRYV